MDITDGRICRGGAQETDHGTYEAVLNIDGKSYWLGERDSLKEALALYGEYRKVRNVGNLAFGLLMDDPDTVPAWVKDNPDIIWTGEYDAF